MSRYENLKFEDMPMNNMETIDGKRIDEYTTSAIKKFRSKHNL